MLSVILSIEGGKKAQKQQLSSAPVAAPAPSRALKAQAVVKAPIPLAITPQAPQPVATLARSPKIEQALTIIAEESGLAPADLTDSTIFADVGIDSLLGLTISARFNEDLEIDLDFNALFFEYPTVGDLKTFLGGSGASSTGVSTPGDSEVASSQTSVSGSRTPIPEEQVATNKVDFEHALRIISEESGVAKEELTEDTNFADSGVDSLLSLVIVSRFREELELDIPHESFFLECPTVLDLKKMLGDISSTEDILKPVQKGKPVANVTSVTAESFLKSDTTALAARKSAVDECVQKHTAGFSSPISRKSGPAANDNEKVVLLTGGSGSLGGHLVYHIAQLSDVKTVVVINRENKAEPYVRQQKAMRDKGIRFPEALKTKLLVYQTDATKPMFGLLRGEYEGIVNSVTHLCHSAWPMSAKRALPGFESQFQIMRNLIDLGWDVTSRRPESFKFSFQMVSSVGVVGHYGLGNGKERTMVPEERVEIDSVLPNGYGDAKWGCERMLDETLHRFPERFRTMTVRLGQIAGSKTSGYWNPMEHFGFLVKSSQTLNALPDVDGTVYWTTVNDIAASLSDLVLSDRIPYPIYHIENPVGQSWREMNLILADALNIPNVIPFKEWVERVRTGPQRNNPAATLLEFLDSNYLRMSCGGLVLDVKKTLEHSKTLAAVGPVSEEIARKYIHIWKEIGFLN